MSHRHPRTTQNASGARTARKDRKARGILTASLAVLACTALGLTGCTSKPQVQASQSSTERRLVFAHTRDLTSTVLANVYVRMLESKGIEAVVGDPVADPAAEVIARRADVAVAGSGDLLAALQKTPGNRPSLEPSASPGGPAITAASANGGKPLTAEQTDKALNELKLGEFALLDSAAASSNGILVTTAATSAGMNLSALAQLPPLCPELDFGVPDSLSASLIPQFSDIYDCAPARVLPVEIGQRSPVEPLITNRVQVLATTADNASVIDNALVVIADSQQLFAPQVLTPLITTREFGQDAIDAINKVSGALKQDDLMTLNRAVTGPDAFAPETAADQWLREKSLVTGP